MDEHTLMILRLIKNLWCSVSEGLCSYCPHSWWTQRMFNTMCDAWWPLLSLSLSTSWQVDLEPWRKPSMVVNFLLRHQTTDQEGAFPGHRTKGQKELEGWLCVASVLLTCSTCPSLSLISAVGWGEAPGAKHWSSSAHQVLQQFWQRALDSSLHRGLQGFSDHLFQIENCDDCDTDSYGNGNKS